MSIASEITRINTNIANAYTSLNAKGATMPQEQNSANLADTIDSVPTGGGGGTPIYRGDWRVPQEYIDLDNAVLDLLENFDDTNCEAVGIYLNKNLFSSREYIFQPNGDIGFYTAYSKNGAKTFSSATLPEGFSGQYKITLDNDENYIIIIRNGYSGAPLYYYNHYYRTRSYAPQQQATEYMTAYYSGNFDGGSFYNNFPNIKEVHALKNGVMNLSYSDLQQMNKCEYIPSITECSYQYLDSLVSGTYTLQFIGWLPNLPDGADFSSATSYNWNFTGDTTQQAGAFLRGRPRLQRMYVTIPPVNITFNSTKDYWQQIGVRLTADNWTYITQHAPTVSGKTITIDMYNEAQLGATNKATLESKGWTVTVLTS